MSRRAEVRNNFRLRKGGTYPRNQSSDSLRLRHDSIFSKPLSMIVRLRARRGDAEDWLYCANIQGGEVGSTGVQLEVWPQDGAAML